MDNPHRLNPDADGDASNAADEAARVVRKTMNDTRDRASDTLHRVSEQAAEMRGKAESAVDGVAKVAKASAGEAAEQLHSTAQRASASMATYIRDEPIKSVVLASVAGAAIVAVASLLGGSRSR